MNTVPNEKALSKDQLRKKRYEDKTKKKVCTLRAHPDKHDLIKRFAKTGHCDKCQQVYEKYQAARSRLKKQVGIPNWNDEFTSRDQMICLYTLAFSFFILLIIDIAKSITI